MIITSKDNDLIKNIKKLKEKKHRDETNSYIIEGIKIIEEAIDENADIEKIVVCNEINEEFSKELLYKIAKYDVIYVSKNVFKLLTDVTNPQGILAVISKKQNTLVDFTKDFYLILDNIQDPGNMGTILRTADSINLNQIIIRQGSVDCYNPKVVRATMGAIFRVNIVESKDMVKTIKELKKHKIKIYATDLKTEKNIYSADYKKSAVIIGNESNGVSEELLDLADEKIKIPMLGKTESLNAGVATGIILYEVVRKKNYDSK